MDEQNLIWVTNVDLEKIIFGDIIFVNGIIGKPQVNGAYSIDNFASLGMVGIYKREGDPNFRAIIHQAFYDSSFSWFRF